MRALIQRVSNARVEVAGETVGAIERGLLVLLGVAPADGEAEANQLAAKLAGLRIFEDPGGKMNLSVLDVGGAVLCVSQFTLLADVRKGNRPSFDGAAPAAQAVAVYEAFCGAIRTNGVTCETGRFGAEMAVHLVNDGPVTILVDTDDLARPRRP